MLIAMVVRSFLLAGLLLPIVGCGRGGPSGQAAAGVAGGGEAGGRVGVLGTWGGAEQDAFLAMVRPFEQQTGIRVDYEGTRDLNAVLTTRVQGGNPPELAGLPGPGQMAVFARQGALVDLSGVLEPTTLQQQFAEDWVRLGSVDGKLVGIFIKATLKGLVWYDARQLPRYTGAEPPRTWDQLLSVSQQIAAGGARPWCIGLSSGATSGWPGTDWIEGILLRQAGPEVYDRWTQGQLAWSSPEVRRAWQTWGQIIGDERMVYGGRQYALATNFGDAGSPLFATPPRCFMQYQASFMADFFKNAYPGLKPVDEVDFFPFPDVDPRYAGAVEVAGDLFGMFRDTPAARALMRYLATAEAQGIWVRRGGALSANRQVPAEAYPDPLARREAQIMANAPIVRFDGSDLMTPGVNDAFFRAILGFTQNPGRLDAILADLDQSQRDSARR